MSQTITKNRYCYSRNGTTLLDAAFQPCNDSTTHSACCMTNHSGAGHVGIANDICEDNGLCQNFMAYDGTNEGQQVWGIQGCTDQLWNSPYCLADVCDTTKYPGDHYGNVGVWNCGGKKWCCGEKSCCGDEKNIFELAATVGSTSTVSLPTTSATIFPLSTTLPLAPTSPATASSSSKQDASSGGLSTGAKAGIGIGAAVLIFLVAAVALLLFRSRKAKERKHIHGDGSIGQTCLVQNQKYHEQAHLHELYPEHGLGEVGEREVAELVTYNAPQELEARSGRVR
ncbi:hypothetical protein OPT61_g3677 [Boeremia exigua]|uniref:Uncharacterized protein n=1 Tax=Boeremia exigua TaxID=749465 RepID=A0ACC2IH06_9PLEO|nr:hypothetical protein OPT61_g3677 [Boeremia exigua]